MPFDMEFETEEHRAVFEAGKELFGSGMTPDAVEIELLVEQQRDRQVVEAVMPSLIKWRDAAARGEVGYFAWLKSVIHAPFRSGIMVFILLLMTVPFTLIAGMLGTALLPGRYLGMIFAVVAGFFFFCIGGGFIYLVKRSKLFAGIAGLIFLVPLLAGWLWLQSKTGALHTHAKEMEKQGAEFGAGTDQEGCLKEALRRDETTDGLGSEAFNHFFLKACLEASAPTPGFCDLVPAPTAVKSSVAWRVLICHEHGRPAGGSCDRLLEGLQDFCAGRSWFGALASPPEVEEGHE